GGDSGPVILLFTGSTWVAQAVSTTVPSSTLDFRSDGLYASLGTYPESATLPSTCTASSLTATVPLSGHSGETVRARVGFTFPGAAVSPRAQVLAKLDGGSYSPPVSLDPGAPVSSATLSGITLDGSPHTVHLCIEGASDGGAMRVDMVRLD